MASHDYPMHSEEIRERLSELIVQDEEGGTIEVTTKEGPIAQALGMALVNLAATIAAPEADNPVEGATKMMELMDEALDEAVSDMVDDEGDANE